MSQRIQLRRDTAADWASVNPVLAQDEPGIETDTGKLKFGDGVSAWASLPYWPSVSQGGSGFAPLASPAFTGTPAAPTAAALTDDTQVATTAYADAAVAVEKTRAQAAEAASLPLADFTALGDTVYGSGAGTAAKLAGNTSTTRKFWRQTGTGTVSAAPAWDTLALGDLPAGTRTYLPPSGDTAGATDTAAINAVVQAGGAALLGAGTYYVKNLLPDSYGAIIGCGAATVLRVAAGTTGYAIALKTPATTAQVTLAGFRLNCNQVCGGIQLDNTGFTSISSFVPYDPLHSVRNVFVLAANGDAYHLDNNARGLSFVDCRQYFASGYGFYLGTGAGASGAGCTDSNFTGCVSGISGNHGVFIAAGSSNNMLTSFKAFWAGYSEASATWVSTTACGIEVQGDWNKLVGCDAQQNALHGIELSSCDSNTVTGNNCDTNSAGSGVTAGTGISVTAATNCAVAGNVGSNNAGLTPGSQAYGYQIAGNCTGSMFYANSVYGTGGGFHYVAGAYGFQVFDQSTLGAWSAAIAQLPSPTYSTYGTTQALANGSTIANGAPSTGGNYAVYPVSATAAVTGLVLAAPSNGAGTSVTVVNTSAFSLTFAASGTSNVADGTADVIPALTARTYVYNGSLWYRYA